MRRGIVRSTRVLPLRFYGLASGGRESAGEYSGSRPIYGAQAIAHELPNGKEFLTTMDIELKEKPDSHSQTILPLTNFRLVRVMDQPRFEEKRDGYYSYWYKIREMKSGKEGYLPLCETPRCRAFR
jgi:hypothetical protein